MRLTLNVLLFLMSLSLGIAAIRAPRDLTQMQREGVKSYTADINAVRGSADFITVSNKQFSLSCNPRREQSCPALALKQALQWKPEVALWHNGSRIYQVELNGQVVLDFAQTSRGRFGIALGGALLCLFTLLVSLAIGWLRSKNADQREREWSATQIPGS
jgi:hypothetical protein